MSDSASKSGQCICCGGGNVIGVETAEVGVSGNWLRGPFCLLHWEKAKRVGRVTAPNPNFEFAEQVSKPEWAEEWQCKSKREQGPITVVSSEMAQDAKKTHRNKVSRLCGSDE